MNDLPKLPDLWEGDDPPPLDADGEDPTEDPWLRLNNLYKITDKDNQVCTFRANEAQRQLWAEMRHRNVILKARQLGFSTFVQLIILDTCLWRKNTTAGIVAHRLEDAKAMFRHKILFALENLPDWCKIARIVKQTETTVELSNGSSITVGTSLRSGTYYLVHISELGRISAQFPQKAEEIRTGALNTMPANGTLFVESTAEGSFGDFYEMCQSAMQNAGRHLSQMDYKLHFFPWFADPGYRLDDAHVTIPAAQETYFAKLERDLGVTLDQAQRRFYVKKVAEQREKVVQEFPSTPDEAFSATSEAQIFAKWMDGCEADGRVGDHFGPVNGLPTYTVWDLGVSDHTAIWWLQFTPDGFRQFFDYYEASGYGVAHYLRILSERAEQHGIYYAPQGHKVPHDAEQRRMGEGTDPTSLMDIIRDKGEAAHFECLPAPHSKWVRVNQTRDLFPFCRFHRSNCSTGLRRLRAYRRRFIQTAQAYADEPVHDDASHCADAFMLHVAFSPGTVVDYSGMDLRPRITGVY